MNVFSSLADTLAHGAPVVRLFRTALGRDPSPAELAAAVGASRRGRSLGAIAADLLGTDEALRMHGPGAAVDEAFASRVADAATGGSALGRLVAAASLDADRAALVAALAESEAARRHVALLPGLVPGAPPDDDIAYALWRHLHEHDPTRTRKEDGSTRADDADREADGEYDDGPGEPPFPVEVQAASGTAAFRFFCVAGDTEIEAALRTFASLQRQHGGADWRFTLAVQPRSAWTREALAKAAAADPRLGCIGTATTASVTGAVTGAVMAAARDSGETAFALLSPGDRLAPDALAAFADHLARAPHHDVVFADDDVRVGGRRQRPRFRPGWSDGSPSHADPGLAVMRGRALARMAAAAADDEPLALQVARDVGERGCGVLPRILLHREEKRLDERTVPRIGAPAPTALVPGAEPSVAILVPTRNNAPLLEACTSGILERTDHPRLALIVVDNGSDQPDALALLERLAGDARVTVLSAPGPFNFASLINRGAAAADADILVLLNNDTEILHPGWLSALVSLAAAPEVGAVGARLLYPDGSIQHAGILLGPGARATHVGRHAALDDPGYLDRFADVHALSAVTGACLAIRRDVFEAVSGMDERFAVTWNDIDLCLRVRRAGLRVLWTPFATLTHHEAKSRTSEADDPASLARFRDEAALALSLWGDALDRDPFLNPNLLAGEDGALVLTTPRVPGLRSADAEAADPHKAAPGPAQLPPGRGFAMSPVSSVASGAAPPGVTRSESHQT